MTDHQSFDNKLQQQGIQTDHDSLKTLIEWAKKTGAVEVITEIDGKTYISPKHRPTNRNGDNTQ